MVKLFSMIVGVGGSAFPVVIDENESVGELKDAIKAKNANDLKDVDARNLQLFLAKKDGAWLASTTDDVKKLKKGEKTPHVVDLTKEDRELQGEDSIANLLAGMETPGTNQIHVLVVVPEKMVADADGPDAWIDAIENEQVTALPLTCEDLKEYLQRPLRIKIPIDEQYHKRISSDNRLGKCARVFDKLFESEPREKVGNLNILIVSSFVVPLYFESRTEQTYHHFWDSLIATLLVRVAKGRYSRNTNAFTSTGLYRPDLCFYYRKSNVCVFRGEEKASGALKVPIEELHQKLTWRYGDAPYIFGYAAVGLQVGLVALRKGNMTEHDVKVETIDTYSLDDLSSRLSFFLALLNLLTLFQPVVNLIQPLNAPEYGTIDRGNGVQIQFSDRFVVKMYPVNMPSNEITRNLKNLHGRMKKRSVPNVVELKSGNMVKRRATLCPVGRPAVPKNVHQLLMALRDILKALVALHSIDIMHRDLRWENVLRYQDKDDKWFLIDFDDGALSPAARVDHLKAESHAPEILLCSSHTVKVDIWSVGYLIQTSKIFDLPAELDKIKDDCLEESPEKRPTAESLFKIVEQLLAA